MAISIMLYDENRERVGETYPRRAKQLVRSGRAVWLEEGHSLLLAANPEPPFPYSKEEEHTMSEDIYASNGATPEVKVASPPTDTNPFLMYLAQKNVAEKKNLIRNIIAYILAWPLLYTLYSRFMYGAFRASSAYEPQVIGFSNNAHEFELVRPFRIEPYGLENIIESFSGSIRGGVNFFVTTPGEAIAYPIEVLTTYNSAWLFIVGVLTAWGAWILMRGFTIARRHLQNKPKRSSRPDPVVMEYQRLQSAAMH